MSRAVIALITGSIPFPGQGDVFGHVVEDWVKKKKKEKKREKWKVLPSLQKKKKT